MKDEEKTPKRGIQRRDFFEAFSSGEMGISRVGKKNQAPFLRLRRKVTLVSIKSFLGFHPTFLCFRGVRFPETSAAPNSADNEAASGGKTNR